MDKLFTLSKKEKMKRQNNYPCKCGHSRINHSMWKGLYASDVDKEILCNVARCRCDNFKADNLKYLENQYDKRSSN